jgi:hypothetical protein
VRGARARRGKGAGTGIAEPGLHQAFGHQPAQVLGRAGLLGELDGHVPLLELSPRQRGLVEALVRGGLLDLAPSPGA